MLHLSWSILPSRISHWVAASDTSDVGVANGRSLPPQHYGGQCFEFFQCCNAVGWLIVRPSIKKLLQLSPNFLFWGPSPVWINYSKTEGWRYINWVDITCNLCMQGGIYVVELIDKFTLAFPLLIVVLLEVLVISYIYGSSYISMLAHTYSIVLSANVTLCCART